MTNFLRRLALSFLALATCAVPLSSAAYGGNMSWDPGDTGGIFQTPVRVRGQYLWITPLSHRQQRMHLMEQRKQERLERRTLILRPVTQWELL